MFTMPSRPVRATGCRWPIPLSVPETGHLLANPPPPGAATHWLA
jgi:hypothetical protein